MAVHLLAYEVGDLCLGKPPLKSLSISAAVADALSALKSSSDTCLNVWTCDHSKSAAEECRKSLHGRCHLLPLQRRKPLFSFLCSQIPCFCLAPQTSWSRQARRTLFQMEYQGNAYFSNLMNEFDVDHDFTTALCWCSGCTQEYNLHHPIILDEATDFFNKHGVSDFTFDTCRLWGWRCRAKLALEKEVTPSSKVRADVVRSGFLNTQKGASDGCQDGNKVSGQLHRYEHLSRMAAIDESESLSDIDDVEVDKYLHSKEEMHYKKIIWEQMNSKHETCQVRPRKRSTEAKKDTPARKASKTTDTVANEKRLSSRINYYALAKLNAELSQGAENANTEGIIAKCDIKFNKKFSTDNRESEIRKYDDEFDHKTDYGEGVESCGDYDSALYYGEGVESCGAYGVDYDYED